MATLRKTVPTTSVYKKLWWHFNVHQREMPRPAKHGDAHWPGLALGTDRGKSDRQWLHQKSLNRWSMARIRRKPKTKRLARQDSEIVAAKRRGGVLIDGLQASSEAFGDHGLDL